MSDDAGNLVGIVTDGICDDWQRVKQTELETLTANSNDANPVVVSPDVLAYHALQ